MTKDDERVAEWPYPVRPTGWELYDDNKDYCGPEGKWYAKLLSRYIFGIDCNRCYWAHDNRYRLGETPEDKEFADSQMLKDQIKAIRAATKWYSPRRYAALVWALRRYHFVCWAGGAAFLNKELPK
jgi:hypothetical protein